MITQAVTFIFAAANYSASAYPGLTSGAAHLILNFGKGDEKNLPSKTLSRKMQGTMLYTESRGEVQLSDITRSLNYGVGLLKSKVKKY